MRTFLAGLVVLPYDRRVAVRWGEIQAYAQLRGRPRPDERQLDRRLLPRLRSPAGDLQHQRLRGL